MATNHQRVCTLTLRQLFLAVGEPHRPTHGKLTGGEARHTPDLEVRIMDVSDTVLLSEF